MPRRPMPWFRFYVETFADPKVRRLSPAHRWLWAAVLGAARQSPDPGVLLVADGVPMTAGDLADFAALGPAEVRRGLKALEAVGLVELDGDTWHVPRWGARQFESDDVTRRTRAHRERSNDTRRNVPTSSEGTGPENRGQRTEAEPPPTPSADPRPSGARRGGGGINELGPQVSGAVRILANADGWRSLSAALTAMTDDGRLDRLTDLAARFPTAPAGDLVQLLDGGPLLRRYITETEEARTA